MQNMKFLLSSQKSIKYHHIKSNKENKFYNDKKSWEPKSQRIQIKKIKAVKNIHTVWKQILKVFSFMKK